MLNIFPGDPDWAIQTQRLIAEAAYGGADIFECDRAAKQIVPGDFESWNHHWHKLGLEVESSGRKALKDGDKVTARQRLFRATNYYRHADFFLPGTDARKFENFVRLSNCFKEAIKLHSRKIEEIQVRCGIEVYDGYFCHPVEPVSSPGPGVLLLGGADSLAEELYFFGGSEIAERGMATLILDTPGRGSSLRLQKIYTRPDYEVPISAAIDYMSGRPEIDSDRIGCVGVSMAGFYAPRGAAFEPRIKALVLWCACYDILRDIYEWYPPIQSQIQWILGVKDDAEARERLLDFNLSGIAEKITCPTMISHGVDDIVMSVEGARQLYDEISSSDKTLKLWEGDHGGAIHCNYDSWNSSIPLMFDWLSKHL
ncbi:MAG: alpha/beta hydrolase [Pseudomonadota bacterium]|nr:alpha/beta hydrolase [Pseudomonadota bacterium]